MSQHAVSTFPLHIAFWTHPNITHVIPLVNKSMVNSQSLLSSTSEQPQEHYYPASRAPLFSCSLSLGSSSVLLSLIYSPSLVILSISMAKNIIYSVMTPKCIFPDIIFLLNKSSYRQMPIIWQFHLFSIHMPPPICFMFLSPEAPSIGFISLYRGWRNDTAVIGSNQDFPATSN